MIDNNNILAIIPARWGSKRLPGKNLRELNGHPLIAFTIDAAKKSKYIDRIIVSTDNREIAEVANKYGAETPFIRPAEFAKDSSLTTEVVKHAIDWLFENERKEYNIICILQPTSPLRSSRHIDESIEKFMNDINASSLISIVEAYENPYWMKTINENGFLESFLHVENNINRSQDLPKIYYPNGAIYLIRLNDFNKYFTFYTPETAFYIMDKASSVDIDDEFDLKLAETLFLEQLKT